MFVSSVNKEKKFNANTFDINPLQYPLEFAALYC